ncbi:MAG TPA: SRPBCC domain-containing protein [Chitinophagaceae bacterium]|nr:SRPBCC domain-containing protein [Chitinophagaceae bacterium]
MAKIFSNKKTVTIHAPVINVWQALTDSEMIKHYFFGVEATGKWNEGSTIVYNGEWQGKKIEGKGKILQVETQKLLKHSYWSNISGLADAPENYHIITYQLTSENGSTKLTLTEENLATKEMKENSAKIWDMVFDNLKKLLERQPETSNH